MSTDATGIAGAMDYQPAGQAAHPRCCVCGCALDGPGTKPVARAWPGLGVVQACSNACAEDARFKHGPGLSPQEAEQLRQELATLRSSVRRLQAAVITARDTFDSYAAHHQAKGTPEAIAKGRANDALMMEMAAALEGIDALTAADTTKGET